MFHNPAAHTVEVKPWLPLAQTASMSQEGFQKSSLQCWAYWSCQLLESIICSLDCLHQRGMVTLDGVIQLDRLREELLEQALKAVIDFSLIAGDLPGNIPDPLLQAVDRSKLVLLTDFVSTVFRHEGCKIVRLTLLDVNVLLNRTKRLSSKRIAFFDLAH